MFLYLDESGDLGFDFKSKQPSRFFVITLIQLDKPFVGKILNKAISNTLNKKVNHSKKKHKVLELKGSNTRLEIKKYFLNYIKQHCSDFQIHTIILDKQNLLKKRPRPIKDILYNQVTYQLLERINATNAKKINLIVDRCKNKLGIKEFNEYLYTNLSLCSNIETRLYITHDNSIKNKGIQAVDLFCYGIARKYESNDYQWYDEYKDKITTEIYFKT